MIYKLKEIQFRLLKHKYGKTMNNFIENPLV